MFCFRALGQPDFNFASDLGPIASFQHLLSIDREKILQHERIYGARSACSDFRFGAALGDGASSEEFEGAAERVGAVPKLNFIQHQGVLGRVPVLFYGEGPGERAQFYIIELL